MRIWKLSVLLAAGSATALAQQAAPPPTKASDASNRQNPALTTTAPGETAQNTSELLSSNGGSLLRASLAAQPDPSAAKASQVSFYAVPPPEPRVLKKHDLVTIIVREESDAKTTGLSNLQKNADFDAKVAQFVKLGAGGLGTAIGATPPEITLNGARDFKGTAEVDRTDSLTLRVQAEILDVKPNNTLVLQARANVTMDDEVQNITLSGTCRAEDVTADNTVLSTQLYDKNVVKTTKGQVRDTTSRGWVPRLLDVLNPF